MEITKEMQVESQEELELLWEKAYRLLMKLVKKKKDKEEIITIHAEGLRRLDKMRKQIKGGEE